MAQGLIAGFLETVVTEKESTEGKEQVEHQSGTMHSSWSRQLPHDQARDHRNLNFMLNQIQNQIILWAAYWEKWKSHTTHPHGDHWSPVVPETGWLIISESVCEKLPRPMQKVESCIKISSRWGKSKEVRQI